MRTEKETTLASPAGPESVVGTLIPVGDVTFLQRQYTRTQLQAFGRTSQEASEIVYQLYLRSGRFR